MDSLDGTMAVFVGVCAILLVLLCIMCHLKMKTKESRILAEKKKNKPSGRSTYTDDVTQQKTAAGVRNSALRKRNLMKPQDLVPINVKPRTSDHPSGMNIQKSPATLENNISQENPAPSSERMKSCPNRISSSKGRNVQTPKVVVAVRKKMEKKGGISQTSSGECADVDSPSTANAWETVRRDKKKKKKKKNKNSDSMSARNSLCVMPNQGRKIAVNCLKPGNYEFEVCEKGGIVKLPSARLIIPSGAVTRQTTFLAALLHKQNRRRGEQELIFMTDALHFWRRRAEEEAQEETLFKFGQLITVHMGSSYSARDTSNPINVMVHRTVSRIQIDWKYFAETRLGIETGIGPFISFQCSETGGYRAVISSEIVTDKQPLLVSLVSLSYLVYVKRLANSPDPSHHFFYILIYRNTPKKSAIVNEEMKAAEGRNEIVLESQTLSAMPGSVMPLSLTAKDMVADAEMCDVPEVANEDFKKTYSFCLAKTDKTRSYGVQDFVKVVCTLTPQGQKPIVSRICFQWTKECSTKGKTVYKTVENKNSVTFNAGNVTFNNTMNATKAECDNAHQLALAASEMTCEITNGVTSRDANSSTNPRNSTRKEILAKPGLLPITYPSHSPQRSPSAPQRNELENPASAAEPASHTHARIVQDEVSNTPVSDSQRTEAVSSSPEDEFDFEFDIQDCSPASTKMPHNGPVATSTPMRKTTQNFGQDESSIEGSTNVKEVKSEDRPSHYENSQETNANDRSKAQGFDSGIVSLTDTSQLEYSQKPLFYDDTSTTKYFMTKDGQRVSKKSHRCDCLSHPHIRHEHMLAEQAMKRELTASPTLSGREKSSTPAQQLAALLPCRTRRRHHTESCISHHHTNGTLELPISTKSMDRNILSNISPKAKAHSVARGTKQSTGMA